MRCGRNSGIAIPPGDVVGQLLVWDGTAWVAQSEGTAAGQLLTWNGTTWVPGAIISGELPWVHGFGLPTAALFANPGWFQSYNWVGAAPSISTPGVTVASFPKSGGVLTYATFSYVGTVAHTQAIDFEVRVNGGATALATQLPGGVVGANDLVFANEVLAATANNYVIEVVYNVPSGINPGNVNSFPRVVVGGYVTP